MSRHPLADRDWYREDEEVIAVFLDGREVRMPRNRLPETHEWEDATQIIDAVPRFVQGREVRDWSDPNEGLSVDAFRERFLRDVDM